MKKKEDKACTITEENIDGLFYIMKGIEMLYDIDLDERSKNRDNLEKVKRIDSNDMTALTAASLASFASPLSDIYACVAVTCKEILGIEEDD